MQAHVETLENMPVSEELGQTLQVMWLKYGRLHDMLSDAMEAGRLKPQDLPDDYPALSEVMTECAGASAAAESLLVRLGLGKHIERDPDQVHAFARAIQASRDSAIRAAERAAFAYFMQCKGGERARAAWVHEGIFCAALLAGVFDVAIEGTPCVPA